MARVTQGATLEPIERASRDELTALQLTRLKWSLSHAYRNVAQIMADAAQAGLSKLGFVTDPKDPR